VSKHELHQRSAIIYQSLYLINLLLLPGIAFVVLLWLFKKQHKQFGWQKIHLFRSVQLSFLAGFFMIIMPLFIIYFAKQFEAAILIVVVYFISVHAFFVMLGMLNIARAMSRKLPVF